MSSDRTGYSARGRRMAGGSGTSGFKLRKCRLWSQIKRIVCLETPLALLLIPCCKVCSWLAGFDGQNTVSRRPVRSDTPSPLAFVDSSDQTLKLCSFLAGRPTVVDASPLTATYITKKYLCMHSRLLQLLQAKKRSARAFSQNPCSHALRGGVGV